MPESAARVFIGLGSNIGDGPAEIRAALDMLGRLPEVRVLRRSSLYRTEPWGPRGQPDFTNAVAELKTTLPPRALMEAMQDCEARLGRTPEPERWGPRRIDLDLLCFGTLQIESEQLVVPHPRMAQRAFVLVPLLELEPAFRIPGVGAARDCLARIGRQNVERLA